MALVSRLSALCIVSSLLLGACGGGTTTPAGSPATLVIVAGDAQSAVVGTAVAAAPTVLVQDGDGRAVAGATVSFAVTSGGGSVTPTTATTNANGVATTAWTLGTIAGANVLTASSGNTSAKTLTATGTPDVAAVIRFAATDTLFLKQGETQAQTVTQADKYGNAIAGTTALVYTVQGTAITVNSSGVVTGVGPGLSSVVASAGTATASRTVGITGHPSGNSRQTVSVPFRPFGLAVSGTQALVTQLDNSSVTRLNITAAPTVVSQIAVSSTPTGISVTPNGVTAFVANQFDNSIGVIDVAAGQQTKKFPFFATTIRTLVSRDGSRAYWTTTGGELAIYNVSTASIMSTSTGFGVANGLALGLGDSTLYVTSMFGGLSAVNVKTGVTIGLAGVTGTLQDVVVSPAGDELYVADEQGRLLVLSSTLTVKGSVAVSGAFGMGLSPDGAHLWITQPSAASITIIDRVTRGVVKVITGFGAPRRVAFDRFGVAVVTDEAGAVHVFR
ncbi:MAG: hypothetical protein JWL61_3024 [Gemmatimonadetes bacterium]|nr:hypothetical protein [Gemmatimonadota bacterium]